MQKHLLILVLLGVLLACRQPPGPYAGQTAKDVAALQLPTGIAYLNRQEWGANAPVLPMRPHKLSRLTLHHTATMQQPNRNLADKLRGLQKFSQEESPLADGRTKPAWADIPYHLYVDVHGKVGEARDLRYAGDSNTSYDPAGHLLVVVEGNFEQELLTEAQRHTLEQLLPALAKQYGLTDNSLGTHKDFAETACPGTNLYKELPRLRGLVSATSNPN